MGLVNDLLILNKPNSSARRPKILAQLCSESYTDKSQTRLKLNLLCNWLFMPTYSYENIPFHLVFFFSEIKNTTYFDYIILIDIQNM